MWPDNETDRDFLNFEGVADTVAELIVQADGQPVSIGVSGAWGVGKSSMIKLIKSSLLNHQSNEKQTRYVYVEFNAWLYQGYDDARAALLDVIASTLSEEATERETGVEKAKEFLGRVRWLRFAKFIALPAASVALGLPPIGFLDGVGQIVEDGLDREGLEQAGSVATNLAATAQSLLAPKQDSSPPREIQALRDSFEEALKEIGITLVVLIDDLDRCLPETTISTLEAIRLFLFLQNTAFVVAADDAMIKHSVKKHFGGLDDGDLVTNYFDKLIQIPIKVPALGTQEVRAYMMMLFIENSDLEAAQKDCIKSAMAAQLRETWKGKRVDRSFIESLNIDISPELTAKLVTAERLAPLMTTSTRIAANPRLIKRFLNALSIRMTISNAQGVGVDEAILAKLLLFERLAQPGAFSELAKAVNEADADGKPSFLIPWEKAAQEGETVPLSGAWDNDFIREWLKLSPALGTEDLRGALYVSREHAPLITAEDRLSSEAAAILEALLSTPEEAIALKEHLATIQKAEMSIIMDRLLSRARQVQEWGSPPILEACITVSEADPSLGATLAGFLIERPGSQIQPNIVPKIGDLAWASQVFEHWQKADDVASTVKKSIQSKDKNQHGNITI